MISATSLSTSLSSSLPSSARHVRPARVAFIQSAWHKDIVDQARLSFTDTMHRAGYGDADIDFFEVPGAFEIPLHAKLLAQSGAYAGIVAAGLVVDGGIYRHDFVATAVIDGLMRVQLDCGVPVFSAVLTPHHFHGGSEHVGFFRDHFIVKGGEVANACIQTIAKVAALTVALNTPLNTALDARLSADDVSADDALAPSLAA